MLIWISVTTFRFRSPSSRCNNISIAFHRRAACKLFKSLRNRENIDFEKHVAVDRRWSVRVARARWPYTTHVGRQMGLFADRGRIHIGTQQHLAISLLLSTKWTRYDEWHFNSIVRLYYSQLILYSLPFFWSTGSFLVAYLVLMLFVGIPLLCMEYAIGQLTQKGLAALANFCPILKGVVVTCLCASISIIFVYTAVNCWSVFYLFKSLFNLPTWSQCNNPWNSRHCLVEGPFPNATQLLIQRYKQYFINNRGALTSALLGTATGAVSAAPSLHSSAPLSLASNATSALFNSTALHALTSSLNATIPLTTPASRGTNNAPTNLVDQALIKQLLNGNFNALHSINLNAIPHVHNFSNLPYLINLASNLTTPINETAQPNQFVYNASFYATQEFHE